MRPMSIAVFFAYLVVLGSGYWLKYLNITWLKAHGRTVPPEFQGIIDPDLLDKMSDYTSENSRLGIIESIFTHMLTILFLFGGLLGAYDSWVLSKTGSLLPGGLLFFLVLMNAELLIDIPFSLFRNFGIENRYGFNTMTARLWSGDLLKSTAISTLLAAIVLCATLALVQASPAWWWLWVWTFFLVFGIFMMYLSPLLIEPLFFKLEPVKAEGLEEKVRLLMEKAGLKVGRVFQSDASRRSRHSNAYFTGLGRVKRIVLFDTLIGQMTQDEILAVLAHEVGHWKKGHVWKRLLMTEAGALLAIYAAFRLLQWGGVPGLIGLPQLSFSGQLVVLAFLSSVFLFPLTPLSSWLSRRHEWQADRFAVELCGTPGALATALVKLTRENLGNLHPHPFYAWFYYSHPPVVERIRKLRTGISSQ